MMSEPESLRNIGSRSAARPKALGVADAKVLERIGAYRLVNTFPHQTSLNLLHTLHGGLPGNPWQDLLEKMKAGLHAEMDR